MPATGFPTRPSPGRRADRRRSVPTSADCPSPETISSTVALPEDTIWVNVTGDPASPGALAVACCTPAAAPSVRSTEASPSLPVVVEGALTLPASAAQAIGTPEIGLPKASVTCTTSGSASVAPAGADWLSPATATSWLASAETAWNWSGAASVRWPPAVGTRTSAVVAAQRGSRAPPGTTPRPSPSVPAVSGSTVAPLARR